MVNTDREYTLTEAIQYLKELIFPERFEKMEKCLLSRTQYMTICLENIVHPHNASAVIRTAEAMGIQTIHAVESCAFFSPSKKIVKGTDKWIDIHKWSSTEELVAYLRKEGKRIVVTSPREGGFTPSDFDVESSPFALFMGTERTGISEWLMKEADSHLHIPMYGFAESLNISVTAAIATQRLMERIRTNDAIKWELSTEDREHLLFDWLYNSVKNPQMLLKRMVKEKQR